MTTVSIVQSLVKLMNSLTPMDMLLKLNAGIVCYYLTPESFSHPLSWYLFAQAVYAVQKQVQSTTNERYSFSEALGHILLAIYLFNSTFLNQETAFSLPTSLAAVPRLFTLLQCNLAVRAMTSWTVQVIEHHNLISNTTPASPVVSSQKQSD